MVIEYRVLGMTHIRKICRIGCAKLNSIGPEAVISSQSAGHETDENRIMGNNDYLRRVTRIKL